MKKIKIFACPYSNPLHELYQKSRRKWRCVLDVEHNEEDCSQITASESYKDFKNLSPAYSSKEKSHACENKYNFYKAYGAAIDDCTEDQYGRLWASNGEYSSMVLYCPFCGYKGTNPEDTELIFEAHYDETEKDKE